MLVTGGVLVGAVLAAGGCHEVQAIADGPGNTIRRKPASGTTLEPESQSDSPLAGRQSSCLLLRMAGSISGQCLSWNPENYPEPAWLSVPSSRQTVARSCSGGIRCSNGCSSTLPAQRSRSAEVGAAPLSISWSDAGIVFSEAGSTRIMRVSPNGGQPEVLVDFTKSDELVDGPQFLPDGRTLLYSVAKRTADFDQSLGHSAGRRAGSRDRCAQDTDRRGQPCLGMYRPDISPISREERCSPCRSISAASR